MVAIAKIRQIHIVLTICYRVEIRKNNMIKILLICFLLVSDGFSSLSKNIFRCECNEGFERVGSNRYTGPCFLKKDFITCATLECGKDGMPFCKEYLDRDAECVCLNGYRYKL